MVLIQQEGITKEDVKKLTQSLKAQSGKWAVDLAFKMYGTDIDYDEEKAKTKIYNISNHIIRSNDVLKQFIEKGLELLNEYNSSTINLKEKLKNL